MRAIYCDRCGMFERATENYTPLTEAKWTRFSKHEFDLGKDVDYLFCPTCSVEFVEFLKPPARAAKA
jgi:hypothetical protein